MCGPVFPTRSLSPGTSGIPSLPFPLRYVWEIFIPENKLLTIRNPCKISLSTDDVFFWNTLQTGDTLTNVTFYIRPKHKYVISNGSTKILTKLYLRSTMYLKIVILGLTHRPLGVCNSSTFSSHFLFLFWTLPEVEIFPESEGIRIWITSTKLIFTIRLKIGFTPRKEMYPYFIKISALPIVTFLIGLNSKSSTWVGSWFVPHECQQVHIYIGRYNSWPSCIFRSKDSSNAYELNRNTKTS